MGPAAHHSCELGGPHGFTAANRHWSWAAGSHSTPCPLEAHPWSDPRFLGSLAPCLPASCFPAAAAHLSHYASSVSAFIPHRRVVPVPSLIANLGTLQVLLCQLFVLLHALLCPRHGAVWSETACCLSTRAVYWESHDPIIVGHSCLPPASSPALSHAWTLRVSHFPMLLISALNGRAS